MISESESSYTSYDFSDMVYGVKFYKIRASDTMEQPNLCEWSDILQISYPSPDNGGPSNNGVIPGYQFIILFLSSFTVIGVIIVKKLKS